MTRSEPTIRSLTEAEIGAVSGGKLSSFMSTVVRTVKETVQKAQKPTSGGWYIPDSTSGTPARWEDGSE